MSCSSNGIVRVEETLQIKICEIKNLPARSQGSPKTRNVFCTVNLDKEPVFTTATVKNSLSPYFGEEIQFEIPRQFRFLNIYVHDKTDHSPNGRTDGALGKVAISKQDLHKYHGKDRWLPVLPIDADSEVTGKVHLEIFRVSKSLAIRIKECSDLTMVKNTCDPFVMVSLNPMAPDQHRNSNDLLFKTRTWKKTVSPRYDETFYFPDDRFDYTTGELRVSLWHEGSNSVVRHVFLGEVRIPVQSFYRGQTHKAWYLLQPRDHSKGNMIEFGTDIRLNIRYSSDHIIASEYYDPLRQLLLNSPSVDPIVSSAVYVLSEMCDDKLDVAKPIVRIFLHHSKLRDLIRQLARLEMEVVCDVNTLFRGNTLLSKCVDELMKFVGRDYLQTVLKEQIDRIFSEQKCCEIDKSRMQDTNDLDGNLENLTDYIADILKALTNSALFCPTLISDLLIELKQSAIAKYPDRPEIQYSVVAGFILLRFFAPAILGPKLFELRKEGCVPTNVARTLTLISKTVQSVGNCLSNETNRAIKKEPYMEPILQRFCAEPYLEQMRVFLNTVSSADIIHSSVSVKLKDGYLIKRAQGRKRWGRKNFLRRYFSLSTQDLSYAKNASSAPLCCIPVSEILAAESVTESSFNLKHMFQVIQPSRQLYIQASNSLDAKEWLDALNCVVRRNQKKRDVFHPSGHESGAWQCCKRKDLTDTGCTTVSQEDVSIQIDLDRELEKVHTLFLENIHSLKRLYGIVRKTQATIVENGNSAYMDDMALQLRTIESIIECVDTLEEKHKQHIHQTCQRNPYGSENAPIGEENYLLLSSATSACRQVSSTKLLKSPLEITRC